jgi:maltooligosyltrehalose trehalohydrolase
LRREDATIALQGEGGLDGATLDDRAFVLRFSGPGRTARADRLLVVNLGPDFELATMPESLIAPPASMSWTVLWSSEDFAYGGNGTPEFAPDEWPVPGHAALLLAPVARIDASAKDDARG